MEFSVQNVMRQINKKTFIIAVSAVAIIVAGVMFTQRNTTTSQTSERSSIQSQYAGQETRAIKALSQDDVEQLLAGAGTAFGGMAKPAELNGYPGPRHILDAVESGEFELADEQQEQIELLYKDMRVQAIELGKQIIDIEISIDDAFSGKTMTEEYLQKQISGSADLYSSLRFVHLKYHLGTVNILTSQQVEQYNELRGYTSSDPCANIPEGHDAEQWKLHNKCG